MKKIIYILKLFLIFNFIFNCENNNKKIKNNKIILDKVISFKDQLGRMIELQKPAEKIIMIPIPGITTLIALDESIKRFTDMSSIGKQQLIDSVIGQLFPNIINLSATIGTFTHSVPNMEELVRLNPDLIFQWGVKAFPKELKSIETMEQLGLKVIAFDWNIGNKKYKDFISEHIKIIGYSINKLKKAKRLINWRRDLKKKLKKYVNKIPKISRLKSLYFVTYKKKYSIYESHSLKLLKANYSKLDLNSNRKEIDSEKLLVLNPDVIILSNFEKNSSPKDFYNNELLNEINAVKSRKVYKMPFLASAMGGDGSHEDPLYWMWMAMIIYPDYFNFDMRKEIKTWYKIMYNKIITKNHLDNILHISVNKESKNYKKFM